MNNPREQAFSSRALLVPQSLERCGLGKYLPSTRRTCPALSCPGPIRLRLPPRILYARLRFLTVFYVMSKHRTATQSKPTFPFAVRFPARAVLSSLAVSFFTFRFHLFGAFFFFFSWHAERKPFYFFARTESGFRIHRPPRQHQLGRLRVLSDLWRHRWSVHQASLWP